VADHHADPAEVQGVVRLPVEEFLSASSLKRPQRVSSGGIGLAFRQPPQANW